MNEAMGRDLEQLVAERKTLLEADGHWSAYSDHETHEAFVRLERVQLALLGCNYVDPAARLIALDLLLEGDDHPNFADDFKNRLFQALRPSPDAALASAAG